jgi:hypothetical protein
MARLNGFPSWPKLKAQVESFQFAGQLKLAIDADDLEEVNRLRTCHHVAFAMNSQRASTTSLFRASEFVLIEQFLALSRASQALHGQFARLNWPQPIDKLAISVIDKPTAAAYYSCNLLWESQFWRGRRLQWGTRNRPSRDRRGRPVFPGGWRSRWPR